MWIASVIFNMHMKVITKTIYFGIIWTRYLKNKSWECECFSSVDKAILITSLLRSTLPWQGSLEYKDRSSPFYCRNTLRRVPLPRSVPQVGETRCSLVLCITAGYFSPSFTIPTDLWANAALFPRQSEPSLLAISFPAYSPPAWQKLSEDNCSNTSQLGGVLFVSLNMTTVRCGRGSSCWHHIHLFPLCCRERCK